MMEVLNIWMIEQIGIQILCGYEKAISKIDESNLKAIAKDLDVDYIHVTRNSDLDDMLEKAKKEATKKVDKTNGESYTDLYMIFVIPLTILLLYEFINYKRKL